MKQLAWNPNYKLRGRLSGLIVTICLLPILFVSMYFGHEEEGLGIGLCSMVVIIAGMVHWSLRNHWWYWLVLLLAFSWHIPVVLSVVWGASYMRAPILIPLGFIDFIAIDRLMKLAFDVATQSNRHNPD